jgi:hypothetical protein
MLVADLPAWSPMLRSRTRLAELRKRHLVDPSLAAALLGADAHGLLADPNTLCYLFESMVARDVQGLKPLPAGCRESRPARAGQATVVGPSAANAVRSVSSRRQRRAWSGGSVGPRR